MDQQTEYEAEQAAEEQRVARRETIVGFAVIASTVLLIGMTVVLIRGRKSPPINIPSSTAQLDQQ
jgi:hypothetical protein